MGIGKRLWNLARAELGALRDAPFLSTVGTRGAKSEDAGWEDAEADAQRKGDAQAKDSQHAQIEKYYANLELPVGSNWSKVKSAYRRLMRQYHPDRHREDPEQQRLATELTQKLRVAYEALDQHLNGKD